MKKVSPGFAFLAIALATGVADARTATTAERTACEAKVQRKIDAVDSRMRAGYEGKEGERLREQRRKLEAERAKCREAAK